MRKILFILCALLISACGSGGGGGSSSDTGSLSLSLEPSRVRIGSLSFVSLSFDGTSFDDLDEEGLNVKFLLPAELEFVKGSAVLALQDGAIEIEPVFDGVVGRVEDEDLDDIAGSGAKFLVFSIPGETLDENARGSIEFNVRATEKELRATISADLDKGEISNFSASDPGFDAEAMAEVDIVEGASSSDDAE